MKTEHKEPRKIVLILGNGFDLDLGLKTSYKDYYESNYCPKVHPSPLIQHLNSCWPDSLEKVRWYDLENELLEYYNVRNDIFFGCDSLSEEESAFLSSFNPLTWQFGKNKKEDALLQSLIDKRFIEYVDDEKKRVSFVPRGTSGHSRAELDYGAFQQIKEGLTQYIESIKEIEPAFDSAAFQVLRSMQLAQKNGDFVSIFTFNYTPVLFDKDLPEVPVYYIHGSIDNHNIIIGTRDDQIMDKDYSYLQKIMDPKYNAPDIFSALKSADHIIIFGHSLGKNDSQYFAPFFIRQVTTENASRKEISLFTYNPESEVALKRSMQEMTGLKLSMLYGINEIKIIKTAYPDFDKNAFAGFLQEFGMTPEDSAVLSHQVFLQGLKSSYDKLSHH